MSIFNGSKDQEFFRLYWSKVKRLIKPCAIFIYMKVHLVFGNKGSLSETSLCLQGTHPTLTLSIQATNLVALGNEMFLGLVGHEPKVRYWAHWSMKNRHVDSGL